MKISKILFTLAATLLVACGNNPPAPEQDSHKPDMEAHIDSLLQQLTLDEKVSLVHASGKFHVNAIPRLGIPELWLSDGPHGVRHQFKRDSWEPAGLEDDHATYLPHLTSVAASWDPEMATLHGSVLGAEARHRGKDIILGPGINLARLPLYGRNFEYMGEDPFLVASLVVPEVKAIQQHDVAANVKHYALNTQELNRIGVNAKPDERTLREVYLPAFEAAVTEGGVYSVMGAYNQVRGTNANQNAHLVQNILKGEWGFDGVLLTDWNVDINTRDAALNGLDLEMGTHVDSYDDYFLAKPFQQLIENGEIPVAVLDEKVRRVLRLMYRVGALGDKNRQTGERNTKEHQQIARTIAANGVVLLKNDDGVLPLDADKLKKVLVIGPNADKKHGQGGGSSEVKSLYEVTPLAGIKSALGDKVEIEVLRARSSRLSPIAADYIASRHWTGTPAWTARFFETPDRKRVIDENWIVNGEYQAKNDNLVHLTMNADVTPLASGDHLLKLNVEGQAKVWVNDQLIFDVSSNKPTQYEHAIALEANQHYQFKVDYDGSGTYVLGWDAPGDLFSSTQEYTAAAKQADAVIYFGGLSHADDREAIDRADMKLPGSQDEIIENLVAANPNTVVFLVAGSAVEMPWADKVKAIVWGWYGGMEAGNAFADVLLGKVNPSGKMPITLPEKLEHTAPIALNDYNAVESLYSEGVFIGYRWFEKQQLKPTFAFGHGLSYTQFQYSDIELSTVEYDGNGELLVSVKVTNTGKRSGAEVVQLYLTDNESSVERPLKELKGFSKVTLNPGETKTITIALNKRDLSFWDVERNGWKAESGAFTVMLGSALDDIRLKTELHYQAGAVTNE